MTRLGWILTGVVVLGIFAGIISGLLLSKGATVNLLLEEKLNDVWVQKYTGTDLEAAIAIPSFTPGGGYDLNYAWRLTKTGTENDYVFDIYWEQGSSHPIELKLTDAGNPNGTETTYEDWTAAKVYIRHRDAQL